MKNNDLNTTWIDIEVHPNSRERFLKRMVYVDLLYRAYIGASGIPSRRFLSIEIPEKDIEFLLNPFLMEQEKVEQLTDRSFLDDQCKRTYILEYRTRRNRLNEE